MNVFDLRDSTARGIFVSDGPAGSFPRKAQLALQSGRIDLDYDTVNFIRQRIALFLPFANEFPDIVEVVCQCAPGIDFESRGVECVQSFPMMVKNIPPISNEHVSKVIQPPLCGDAGFELAYGSCSCIARIRELREPVLLPLLVHFLE